MLVKYLQCYVCTVLQHLALCPVVSVVRVRQRLRTDVDSVKNLYVMIVYARVAPVMVISVNSALWWSKYTVCWTNSHSQLVILLKKPIHLINFILSYLHKYRHTIDYYQKVLHFLHCWCWLLYLDFKNCNKLRVFCIC